MYFGMRVSVTSRLSPSYCPLFACFYANLASAFISHRFQNYTIPMEERPDCSAWSFSITKAYSASVRAGFILYKREPETNKAAMVDTISSSYTMTNGLFRCVLIAG